MTILVGDCRERMRTLEPESVDAIVCDPPYGLEFMGKEWDRLTEDRPNAAAWKGRRGTKQITKRSDDGPCETPWAKESSGYRGNARQSFKRCTKCGKRSFSGSPCKCPDPEWAIEYPEGPPTGAVVMQRWHESWAVEAFRVLRPGGHLLAFGGTRTFHRLTVAIEDAGFEIRDCLSWLYGSGFPKSLDVSKAIDKMRRRDYVQAAIDLGITIPGNNLHDWTKAEHSPGDEWWERFKAYLSPEQWGAIERRVIGSDDKGEGSWFGADGEFDLTAPATPEAAQWAGWGTALKPAWEPVIVARKPLVGTVAANVLAHGTGALNIDGCRIVTDGGGWNGLGHTHDETQWRLNNPDGVQRSVGRWPANTILDESAAALLDEMSGERKSPKTYTRKADGFGSTSYRVGEPAGKESLNYGDTGGASRFFKVVSPDAYSDSSCYNGMDQEDTACGDDLTEAESTSAGKRTGSSDGNSRTDGFGNRQTALSLTDTKSTTETRTRSTTTSATSSASPRNGTTTTISGNGKITESLTALSNDGASGAANTSPSTTSPSGDPAPITGTAKPAPANTSETGNAATTNTPAPGSASGTPSASQPDPFLTVPLDDPEAEVTRFGYFPKASRRERNAGLEGMPEQHIRRMSGGEYAHNSGSTVSSKNGAHSQNHHPTVKPIALMRWLVRLVTPPGGTVLDPFAGSGSTGCAAVLEGFEFIGVEQDPTYAQIAERRIAFWRENGDKPVKAIGPKESTGRSQGWRQGSRSPRCPEHGESFTSGSKHYRCGCPFVRGKEHDPSLRQPRPTVLQPALPLEGAAD